MRSTFSHAVAVSLLAPLGLAAACRGSTDSAGADDTASHTEAVSYCGNPATEGIDVSEHNGWIDWNAVKTDSIAFAFIKATQSADGYAYVDPSFHDNWSRAKSAGVIRSAYHFFDPTISGVDQANHFLATVGSLGAGDLPPMLDLECPNQQLNCRFDGDDVTWVDPALIQKRALDFLHTVEQKTGKRPMIYTYYYWFSDAGGVDSTALSAYPLDYAAYAPPTSCVNLPPGWSKYTFWQYDDGTNGFGRYVNGVGWVDIDRYNGTLSQLKSYAASTTSGASGPPASCPLGNGLYCGQHDVSGNALKLYDCENGTLAAVATCPLGCERMPDNVNDRCYPGSACPEGDGLYCGGHEVGGDPHVLYQCSSGSLSKVQTCANGCDRMPPLVNDQCK